MTIHPWLVHPWAFVLLAMLPVLGIVMVFALRRRRLAQQQFGRLSAVETYPERHILRVACLIAGLALLIGGIAGPHWGRDSELALAPGRDLVAVLDLSRSMLAEDVLPNRLGRAKEALADLADTLQRRGGHRLALVAFAGRAKVVCPLTHDYDHFRDKLAELDAAHLPPDLQPGTTSPASGTRMGAGLREAVQAQDARFRGFQDILIISDGDDPARDDEWQVGADEARAQGIPVHAIGVGDPEKDSPIPAPDGFLRHNAQEVKTRLQERPLEEIARQTGGTYTPARTSAVRLGELFRERIEPLARRDQDMDALPLYRQRYPWFFAAALVLLAAEMVIPSKKQLVPNGKPPGKAPKP